MPYTVELDLTPPDMGSISRFALPDAPAAVQPHWLLGSWYGRDLLKVALRKLHPERAAPGYRRAPQADERKRPSITP